MHDYTSGALSDYSPEDVDGLLTDRLEKAKERLDDAIEALYQLCADVPMPQKSTEYYHYFCGDPFNPDDLKTNEEKRLTFYKLVVALIRAYNNIAAEIIEAGYSQSEADKIKAKVNDYAQLRDSMKHYSGDYIDLKKYEPDMRQMLDMYLASDPSRVISNFGDAPLLQLIAQQGVEKASDNLPDTIKKNPDMLSEAVENNMRKAIIEQMPTNPAYFERMSVLLLELVRLRKEGAIQYEELLRKYHDLASQLQAQDKKSYPNEIDSKPKQALYDNLQQNIELAITLDSEIRKTKDNDWRGNIIKKRKIENIIRKTLKDFNVYDETEIEAKVAEILELVVNQNEY